VLRNWNLFCFPCHIYHLMKNFVLYFVLTNFKFIKAKNDCTTAVVGVFFVLFSSCIMSSI
jgi:hypothetical protein